MKNLIEVLCVHQLLVNVTGAEWEALKNGQGAQRFLARAGIERAELTVYLRSFFADVQKKDNLIVSFADGKAQRVPYNRLMRSISCFTDRLTQ